MAYDVLIIGGGSAGVAAALASARQGANTLLVERHGCLGGAGTASLVHSFCGLYELPPTPDAAPRVANPGLPVELERELRACGIGHGPLRMGKVDVLMHQPQRLALFYDQLCRREPNLEVMLHTEVIGCHFRDDTIDILQLFCRGLRFAIPTGIVVDASGDAEIAMLAGHAYEQAPSEQLQRPAYIVGITGVAADTLSGDGPLKIAGTLARAIKDGALPAEAAGAHFRSSVSADEVFLTLDLPGGGSGKPYSGWEPTCVSRVEMQGREVVFAIVDHLRSTLEGFTSARVSMLPAQAGIRESRRWTGDSVLTEEDILESRDHPEAVAFATWPLELRETARGPRLLYPHESKACGIPLGCLRARDLRNVFIAGRCISATHRAQASIRVMGTALATGQAAGIAAAKLAKTKNKIASTSVLAKHVRKVLNGLAK